MKVNYLPKNRSNQSYLKKILILLAVFVLGSAFFYFLDGVVISLFSPLWRIENKIIMNGDLEPILDQQTQENKILELVGRKQNANTVIAAVLTHPPQTPYDIIIIDAGTNESINVDSEVSLPEGPILGRVSEIFPDNAKVELFSTNGRETNAFLEREDVPVVLVGRGGGDFRFTLPREVVVERGDRIISTHISSRLIAVVEDISISSTDSFQEVLAQSPTNIFSLRFVFVTP